MRVRPDFLVARPLEGLVAHDDARGALRVLIASLAHGGAERIVLEWLQSEARCGRAIELAVLNRRKHAWDAPEGVHARVRGGESTEAFLHALARDWRGSSEPVSVHLVADEHMSILWEEGIRTVPVVHNARDGWRNDPASWNCANVPLAIACAGSVREQMREAGCRVPIVALRHRPLVGREAFDPAQRSAIRAALGVGEATFLVGAVGAIKPQKDYVRAVEVLAALAARRDAALTIVGGVLDRSGVAELDRIAGAAANLGVASRLKLPGFADPIEAYYAAFDAFLNVSRYEGLSIAAQEALAAGLPVVATDVGGQREIEHAGFTVVAPDALPGAFAQALAALPVRGRLAPERRKRAPRLWSVALASRPVSQPTIDTLFVTANLNAGGAQRSLVNLALQLEGRHAFAIAVCGESTHAHFATALSERGIEAFRPAPDADPFAVAESVLAHAARRGARNLCFWNVDAKVKLLAARFAPEGLRIVDVSPGHYAFDEMDAVADFADAIGFRALEYAARLDTLVHKYAAPPDARFRCLRVVRNGVAMRAMNAARPPHPRYLVSGRIAPSKHLEALLDAFERVSTRHPQAQLHLVGQAEQRHAEYADRLAERATALRVHFRGAMPDLAHLDEPFTAAVVLGTHQGSPNAVLEAMAAGIPVIANDSGGTREMLDDGAAGWLLPEVFEPREVAAAMESCFLDPAVSVERARRAHRRARDHHSLEAMAASYLEILGAEGGATHAKMAAWNSVSAPAAPTPSPSAPSPTTAG